MRETINGAGRALYGAAIVLLTEEKIMVASIVFLIAIILVLSSLREERSANYIAMFSREITVAVAAASLVELLLGNIVSSAILVLIMFASNKMQAFIEVYFTSK